MNENQKYNKQIPYEIRISIASAIEAMEYWLSNEVFKGNINIDNVTFNEKDHFIIKLNNNK